MSTVKSKNLQVGTDATASNNFTIYQPSTPDGTLRIGVGNADSPTEVGRFNNSGYVPATAPAFRAYNTSAQAMSSGAWTKIQFPTESFDTDSCYDTTNHRFTPTVKGMYIFMGRVGHQPVTSNYYIPILYVNGAQIGRGIQTNPNGNYGGSGGTWIVELNGTTDYVEFYCLSATGVNTEAGANITWWSGTLIYRT